MDKTLRQLSKVYPDITWMTVEPNSDVLNNFGDGVILRGEKDGAMKEFFILSKDENKFRWGQVIANYVNKTIEEED